MKPKSAARRPRHDARRPNAEPLIWTFDGELHTCLADAEATLRRAIVQLGEVANVLVALDVSLPALAARVRAGDRIQPAWKQFVERCARYGLPAPLRVRPLRDDGPLIALVIVYRAAGRDASSRSTTKGSAWR